MTNPTDEAKEQAQRPPERIYLSSQWNEAPQEIDGGFWRFEGGPDDIEYRIAAALPQPIRREFDVKFLDHIQGTNSAAWQCGKCGGTWVSPANLLCPYCKDNRIAGPVPQPTGEHKHWILRAGVEATMCGLDVVGLTATPFSDDATCPVCKVVVFGYSAGRASVLAAQPQFDAAAAAREIAVSMTMEDFLTAQCAVKGTAVTPNFRPVELMESIIQRHMKGGGE